MRLVPAEEAQEIGVERRIFQRAQVDMRITGRRTDHNLAARREPYLNLRLQDVSIGGCGGISQAPLASGERVVLFFPPQGDQPGWDAVGYVRRCSPAREGYHVGVEFDRLPMAA
ncbi:MAG: PilZ domain-containing protein [Phycisphaerae bacterium]